MANQPVNMEKLVEVLSLAQREFLECHSMLDRLGVSRGHEGARLSLSQRIGVMVSNHEAAAIARSALSKAAQR
jgi:hypothetical protein